METVKDVVKSLTNTFETKSQNLEEKLSIMTERLGRLEVKTQRPLSENSINNYEEKNAFRKFLNKGEWEEKSLSSAPEDGGFLIPSTINNHIHSMMQTSSAMRQLASSIAISTDAIDFLVSQDEAEAGWASETEQRSETKTPKLKKIKIPVHEMYAKPRATQKLLDDAKVNVESWIASQVAEKMARLENQAFIRGTGEKQPKGFLSYEMVVGKSEWGKLQTFKTGKDGQFSDINPMDVLIDTVSSLKTTYLPGAKWLMSRSAAAAISKLKDKNGLPLWNADLNSKASATLLGYEVVICDDMPEITEKDTAAIAFGNFREGYSIVDRHDTRIMRDPYSAKPYIEFYTTRRVGGDVINFDAIKLISFSK